MNSKGISLIAVIIVMLVVATLALIVASTMSTQNISSVADMQGEQAIYLAQAGMEWYLEQLEGDSDWSNPPTVKTDQSFGAGTFTIYYANEATNSIDVTATGEITAWDGNTVQRVITLHVTKVSAIGSYPGGVPEAFDYASFTFGAQMNFQFSTGTVNGDIASTNSITKYGGMTITGSITEDSLVAEPSPVDMAGYESIADNIESAGFTFTDGTTYGSPGSEEIWYVQGNAAIEANVTIYGTVIAEGNLSIGNDSITIDAASGYPSLISGGNLSASSLANSTIDGLIYSDGSLTLGSMDNVVITGAVLADGNISMKNGPDFTITYDSDVVTNPPPYFDGYVPGATTMTTSLWQESL